jgi:4-amino-4-deoxy-L-arabinose transferase-like glycosyltransferase
VFASFFIPQAGIQTDEALFGNGIYEMAGIAHSVSIFHHRVPLMLMSYIGALKSWLYTPLFRVWKPSAASIRLPVILAGALTIALFSSLLRRIGGTRAAAIGLVLLSTDTSFLLTTCFDWGPVVLQHLLLVSGVLCLFRFRQENRPGFLAAGFLFFGLGIWDKALFAWMLAGLGIATLVVFPREFWKSFTPRNLIIAILTFAIGAAPLIRYNVRQNLETLRANAAWNTRDVPGKTRVMMTTFSGQAMFGYLTRDDPGPRAGRPQNLPGRLSLWISKTARHPQNGFLFYVFLTSLVLAIWLWRSPSGKPILFFFLAIAIAWLQMLLGKGVGGAVHHVMLLWPFPTLIIALAFAEGSRRFERIGAPVAATAILIVSARNLLITNEYYARLVTNGPGQVWTDAIYPLSDSLRLVKPGPIYLDDWGMFDNLRILNRGTLPLRVGSDPLSKPQFDANDRTEMLRRLSEAAAVFVGYPDGAEQFAGVNAHLRAFAAETGFEREMLARIPDRNGRIIFEICRFYRISKTPNTTPKSRVLSGSVKVRPTSAATSTDALPAKLAGRA